MGRVVVMRDNVRTDRLMVIRVRFLREMSSQLIVDMIVFHMVEQVDVFVQDCSIFERSRGDRSVGGNGLCIRG